MTAIHLWSSVHRRQHAQRFKYSITQNLLGGFQSLNRDSYIYSKNECDAKRIDWINELRKSFSSFTTRMSSKKDYYSTCVYFFWRGIRIMGGDVYSWHCTSDFVGYCGLSILVPLGLFSRKPFNGFNKKNLKHQSLNEA